MSGQKAIAPSALGHGLWTTLGTALTSLVCSWREEQLARTPSPSETSAIQSIPIPFSQTEDDWGRAGKGISFDFSGEPKSGTTWIGRVMVNLALELCGSATNQWCEMGGLRVYPNKPDASYEFELIEAETLKLSMHFKGTVKHKIPGLDVGHGCNPNGHIHANGFETQRPCSGLLRARITREKLLECLPDTSPRCTPYLPSQDPGVRRIAVIFRDPRDVVISEHRMRIEVYHMKVEKLYPFIQRRLQTIISWMHQRWVWHTTFLSNVSHVMFYEDLQENSIHISSLAEFMGLDCSPGQAQSIWEANRHGSPHGGYNSYNRLTVEAIEWMNVTMAKLLPEPMLARWGLTPTLTNAH